MASAVWFTSDEHYGHARVIDHMGRPFTSVEEMNEGLIEAHNNLVTRGDRVYHLGDFAWHGHEEFVSRLKGQHYLVKGNHDRLRGKIPKGFIWVKDAELINVSEHHFFMSHYAHRVWPQSHYGAFHVYGHSHGMIENFNRSMDVGVDAHSYRPVNAEDVVRLLIDRPFSNHHPEQS